MGGDPLHRRDIVAMGSRAIESGVGEKGDHRLLVVLAHPCFPRRTKLRPLYEEIRIGVKEPAGRRYAMICVKRRRAIAPASLALDQCRPISMAETINARMRATLGCGQRPNAGGRAMGTRRETESWRTAQG